jgi:hypothetical protein
LGIGDWGLGIGPIPNPQSPIPNPQRMKFFLYKKLLFIKLLKLNFKEDIFENE